MQECVFPSGRAAIAQILESVDWAPDAAVAVSTPASECLVRVVRRFGTPVGLRAIDRCASAAVVYEQWGWPLHPEAWDPLEVRFKGQLLLLDRVDSADFFARAAPPGTVDVVSLAKLLGIDGGGLARAEGRLLCFEAQPMSDATRRLLHRPLADLARAGYREIFKESRQCVHPAAAAWLDRNCLETAAEAERIARQRHLEALLATGLSTKWPAWMLGAIARGAGPVWAPILWGQDLNDQWRVMRTLRERYGVVSASKPFNWSGDPSQPQYGTCLALPVHSGVTNFEEIVAGLVS